MDTVFESVEETGRLLVAAEDRSFAGFVRSIQGFVVEKYPYTKALGQKTFPNFSISHLGRCNHLTKEDIIESAQYIYGQSAHGATRTIPMPVGYVPPRFFIS